MSEQNMKVTSTTGGGPATTLVVGDQIAVNLVATKPDGSRMSASGLFNHMGEAVNADGKAVPGQPGLHIENLGGAAMPEFPSVKYQELVESGQMEAAEDLKTAYEMELSKWQEEGNLALPDGIANMVLEWADRVHGVKTTDGDHPVIKPEQVVVKNVIRENAQQPGVFTVQLTPSWG
jgi:hypothetical protein